MATIPEAIAVAIEHHRAGRLQEAELIYRQVLDVDAENFDAMHLLGVVAHNMGKHEFAIECIKKALRWNERVAACHSNLGEAYRALGNFSEAAACYRRAIELDPSYAEAHNNLALVLKEHGELDEAVACLRRALEINPSFVDAHNNLGHTFQKLERWEDAIAACRRALELNPDYFAAHVNLGIAFKHQGKLDDAVACYRRALELKPDFADTHNNLGIALHNQGAIEEAAACFRRALERKSNFAEAEYNLGAAHLQLGELNEAIGCFRRALTIKPEYVEAAVNLGNDLNDQGKLDDAAHWFRRVLELRPDFLDMYNNLGNLFREQQKNEEAVFYFRQALALAPDHLEILYNLGLVYHEQGKLDEAMGSFCRFLELNPTLPEAHFHLAGIFKNQGELGKAENSYRRALELKPNYMEAFNNLGNTLKDLGKIDEALASYRRALELRPSLANVHSNVLFALQYGTGITLASLADAHAAFNRQYAMPLRSANVRRERDLDRRRPLRLGFVSPDFVKHPVGYFLAFVLEFLRERPYEIICYSDRFTKDEMTYRFQAASTEWRDSLGWSDERLDDQIRADRIDVLFDLAGHTARNRMLVFARKPAPIQITWMGYMCTTGLEAMDYLLDDRYGVPETAERYFSERVLRMPDGHVCYDPPAYAPKVSPLPAFERGYVTFCCFNNPAKITSQMIAVWAKILRRLPTARLVFKSKGMDNAPTIKRFTEAFATNGVPVRQLEFLGGSPHVDLLREYQRIDVALDTSPYTGCLTTCESLWMGVPVITFPGETLTSRQSYSCIVNAGLTGTVAGNLDEYVELAVSLASDLPRLAQLRAGLRQQMARSPLCDGKRFANNLASVLDDVWTKWINHGNHS